MSFKVLVILSLIAAASCSPTLPILKGGLLGGLHGGHHTGVGIGGGIGGGLGGIVKGVFGLINGVARTAANALNTVANIVIGSINSVFSVVVNLSLVLQVTLNNLVVGLGSLFIRLTACIIKIAICLLGLPGDRSVCAAGWNAKFGVNGELSAGADIAAYINMFRLKNSQAQLNAFINSYTNGKGISAARGSAYIVFNQMNTLCGFITSKQITKQTVSQLVVIMTTISASISNSEKANSGEQLIDDFIPKCGKYLKNSGYPDITHQITIIKKACSSANKDNINWNGNGSTGGSTGGNNGGSTGGNNGGSIGGNNGGGIGGNNGGSTGGNNGGSTGGNNGGSIGGNNGGSTGGNNGGSTGGNNGGSIGGNNGGSTGGHNGGSTGGNNSGSTGGNSNGSTGGNNGGSNGGNNNGSTGGNNGGSTGGNNGSSIGGNNGGSTGGNNGGSTGGNNNGSTGGHNGGSTGGNSSGSTGGNNGGSTGGNNGGSTGGNNGGSTGGNNGGSTGENNNGSTGGHSGGSTGGNNSGSTGGNNGGSTGGNNGGSTGGNNGGSTGGNNGGSTGGNNGGSTGGNTGSNTGGNNGGSTGGTSGGNTGISVGGSLNLGGILKGVFGVINGVAKTALGALNAVIKTVISSLSAVFDVVANLILVLQVTLNNLVAGLGSLFVRLVACIIKIAVCVLGLPGDKGVCARGWNAKFGINGELGANADAAAYVKLFRLATSQADFDEYIRVYTGGRGIGSATGSARIVLNQVNTLCGYITNYKQISKDTVTQTIVRITTIAASISNSRKTNSGVEIIDKLVPKCGKYLKDAGYPDISDEVVVIKQECGSANGDQINWDGNGSTGGSTDGNDGQNNGGDTKGDDNNVGNTKGDDNSGENTKGDDNNGGNTQGDDNNGGNTKEDGNNGGNTKGDDNNEGNAKGDDNNGENNKGDDNDGGNTKGDDNNGGNTKGDDNNVGNTKGDDNNGGNTKGDDNNGGNTKGDDNNGGNTKGDNNNGGNNEGDDNNGGDTKGDDNNGGSTGGSISGDNCGKVIGGALQIIPGVDQSIISTLINLKVSTFTGAINLIANLTIALGQIIDAIISGLGSILVRIIAVIFKIGYCVNGLGSDKNICTKDWNAQFGIIGDASTTADLISLFRLNNCKTDVQTIIAAYTKTNGSATGLVQVIIKLVTDLSNIVTSASITKATFTTVTINIFSLFGSICDSYKAGSGTVIIKQVLPILSKFFVNAGFSNILNQLNTIVANINLGAKVKFNWSVVKTGGDALVNKVKEVFKDVQGTSKINKPSLTAVLNIQAARSFNDVISFGINVVQALSSVIDVFISGLGSLIARIVGALINYIVAILGAARNAKSFVAQKAYYESFGVSVSGKSWADISAGFKINNCKADLDGILNAYTKNKGLKSLNGARLVIFNCAYSLADIVAKGTGIVEADLTAVFKQVTTLLGGFANSLSAGVGKTICDNLLPTTSYYLEQNGYSSLSASSTSSIYATIETCNNVAVPWSGSASTSVSN